MKSEPVLTAAGLTAFIAAVITLLELFDVIDLSTAQYEQILVVVGMVAPLVLGLWARSKVTPVANPKDATGAPLVRYDGQPAKTDGG